ncbi:GNAT family N-acetyltransferase [soil metagenome]
MTTEILRADYSDPRDAQAIVALLDEYARDEMGGAHALEPQVLARLVPALARRPTALSIIAFVDGQEAGLANAFEGFSTFRARPLLNIHDFMVSRPYRKLGIAKLMLAELERIANERDCCKLTLEVLSGNVAARALYASVGFGGYQLDPAAGQAEFWQKLL